ncbi:PDR/VanB family oxidoreductase [Nocardia takedensis]
MTARDLRLTVAETRMLCPDVREIVFRDPRGATLPSFPPGSHLAVRWAPGRRNAYSLTGQSLEPDRYAISVRLDPNGRGGSRWMHRLRVGETVEASAPRSAFAPVAVARHHLLLAGGIGVTPILSHVRAAVRWGRSFEVLYAHRSGVAPHRAELVDLCGPRLTLATSRAVFRERLLSRLSSSPLGAHLYVCGPTGMVEDVTAAARAAGWPPGRVHVEAFGEPAVAGGAAFTARLVRSGREVAVAADVSLLDALCASGTAIPNLCRRGVCGECRVGVRAGGVDHRDSYLTEEERAVALMPCVSRAAAASLELDL